MSEELGKEMLIGAAMAVAVEGYKDTLQPACKAIGNILGLPFQAIDAALSGPKLWVAEKQFNYERTRQLLAEKMKDVPIEKIVPPENYVAVPALQQISYCYDSDELREMYANLLASSMNEDKKWRVHPGFVDIIKQLCPDEAKILRYLSFHNIVPSIKLRHQNKNGEGHDIIKNFSNVGDLCGCERPNDISKYFDNLVRLGLVEAAPPLSSLIKKDIYEPLKTHPYIIGFYHDASKRKDEYNIPMFEEGYFSITSYGKSFCEICLNTENTQEPEQG